MENILKRVLVIDDEALARELIRRILEKEGYEIAEAVNGEQGVESFKGRPCDLVITDLVMPVKDGINTILEIRQLVPDLPILAVSGGGAIAKERYLNAAGYIDGVTTLAKPFTRQQLVDAVAFCLENRDSQPSSSH